MKKTLMVLAAMMCIAQADTVITFEETAPDFATDNMYINSKGTSVSSPLQYGGSIAFTAPGGNAFVHDLADVWQNSAALDELNRLVNAELTASDLNGLKYSANGGARTSTMTLSRFAGSPDEDSTVIVYALVSNYNDGSISLSSSATGLSNLVMSVATADGSGFSSYTSGAAITMTKGTPFLFRIQADITNKDDYSLIMTANSRSGFALIAATPEPATATLSLLAIAGLAARRRRH